MSLSWLLSLFSLQCWRRCPLPPAPPSVALGSSASPPSMRSTITKAYRTLSLSKVAETNKQKINPPKHSPLLFLPTISLVHIPPPRMHHSEHSLTRDARTHVPEEHRLVRVLSSEMHEMCHRSSSSSFISEQTITSHIGRVLSRKDRIRCMLPSSGDAPSRHRWQPDYFLSLGCSLWRY